MTHAVTNHTAEYYLRWHSRCGSDVLDNSGLRKFFSRLRRPDLPELHAALVLLAAGHGPARLPTCEQALQHVWSQRRESEAVAPPILIRVLSLFRPHELRELRVAHAEAFTVVTSFLERNDDVGSAPSQAIASLSVLECPVECFFYPDPAIALIERHAATIRELVCTVVRPNAKATLGRAVARCTQLESLTYAHALEPSVWLPLSHLHTLLSVDLSVVSIAAIAAALPRLHTLEAYHSRDRAAPAATVAGLLEDLVPRLRVFHFYGAWPETECDAPAIAPPHDPTPALPMQELGLHHPNPNLALRFFGLVQPVALQVHYEVIDQWLAADPVAARGRLPMARLRRLHVASPGSRGLEAHQVAQILRAAPQLQTLVIENVRASWYTSLERPMPPSLVGMRHRCLRHIHLRNPWATGNELPVGCATRLRQRHFPRLVSIASGDRRQFATELDHEVQAISYRVATLLARLTRG